MNHDQRFRLEELAKEAGVSPRTVRYYVQRGLLRPPEFRGKDTTYSTDHLLRLQAIRALQARHLPLDAIEIELSGAVGQQLEALARLDAPASPRSDADASTTYGRHAAPGARGEELRRYLLAPGVELLVSENALVRSAELVRELLEYARKGRKV